MTTAEAWAEATATKTLDLGEMEQLAKYSVEAWKAYETQKKAASDCLKLAEEIDAKISTALKDAGKRSYKSELGTFSISQKAIVRVPGSIDEKKKFFEYLRQLGEDVFFAMATVNSNTLNSWYRERLDQALSTGTLGFSVPGIDEPTTRETLSFRKA